MEGGRRLRRRLRRGFVSHISFAYIMRLPQTAFVAMVAIVAADMKRIESNLNPL